MTATPRTTYDVFFRSAFLGRTQFDYQWQLAVIEPLPLLINAVPCAGNTAASTGAKGSGV